MLVVYANVCAPCKFRSQMRYIQRRAREIGTMVKIVEAFGSRSVLEEAKSLSDVDMPFVYNTDTRSSISLRDVREGFDI